MLCSRARKELVRGRSPRSTRPRYGPLTPLGVIRWIKTKIEQPSLEKAYLVDPYLGSDALKRVVARQGNDNAELCIVVSPGRVDPDADAAATSTGIDYLAKLISTATDWADKLAGQISVVHIKRGDGSRQAFHDRHLCLIDRKGVPTAYLLSNSLSKAAGDWPFTICELDRVMSWRAHADILKMVQGCIGELQPEVIWRRPDASTASNPIVLEASAPRKTEPDWAAPVNGLLSSIWNIIVRNSEFKPQVGELIDAFLNAWPQDVDLAKFAEALFKVASHRDAIVVYVSDRLRGGGRSELANMLDERLLDQTLELLPDAHRRSEWFVPFDVRRIVLETLAKTIARKQNATNFLRAKLNPKVHALVSMVETQRINQTHAWEAYEAALLLSIIALEVAAQVDAPQSYKMGVATDYIHWLGRLMRSDVAASAYVALDPVPPEWLDDLVFAAETVAKTHGTLGNSLDEPIGRVTTDPWVAQKFKDKLKSSLRDQGIQ